MGAERYRRAGGLGGLAGCLAASVVIAACLPAASSAQPKPTTEFQCKKEFKRGSKGWVQNRAACIKRLKREKPGISCKYPLESRENIDQSHSGDTKDFAVELLFRSTDEVEFGEAVKVQLKVTLLNPSRVELCSRAEVADFVRPSEAPKGPYPIVYYYVSIPPNGGLSEVVTIKRGRALGAAAYARLKR